MRRTLVLALLCAIPPAPLFADQSALSQLRSRVADEQMPAAPSAGPGLEAQPCVLRDQFWGTCFYNQYGIMIYWIIRDWAGGPLGRMIIGYPSVLEQEEQYEHWCFNVNSHPEDFPGVAWALDRTQGSWKASRFEYLCPPDKLGELNEWTLRIPYYKAGVRTMGLWAGFQTDCADAMDESGASIVSEDACKAGIAEFDPALIKGDSAQAGFLRLRAKWLKLAYKDSRRFEEVLRTLPPDANRPELFPKDLLATLSSIAADMDEDNRQAEKIAELHGDDAPADPLSDELK